MYGSEKAEPREDAVVKQLFTPSPERRRRRDRADKGSPTNRRKGAGGRRRTNGGFRLGVIGVCFFLLMCGLAVWVTVKLNRGWMDVTMEGKRVHAMCIRSSNTRTHTHSVCFVLCMHAVVNACYIQ